MGGETKCCSFAQFNDVFVHHNLAIASSLKEKKKTIFQLILYILEACLQVIQSLPSKEPHSWCSPKSPYVVVQNESMSTGQAPTVHGMLDTPIAMIP